MSSHASAILEAAQQRFKLYKSTSKDLLGGINSGDVRKYGQAWKTIRDNDSYNRDNLIDPVGFMYSADVYDTWLYLGDWITRLQEQFKPSPSVDKLQNLQVVLQNGIIAVTSASAEEQKAQDSATQGQVNAEGLLSHDMQEGASDRQIASASVAVFMSLQDPFTWLLEMRTVMSRVWQSNLDKDIRSKVSTASVFARLNAIALSREWKQWNDLRDKFRQPYDNAKRKDQTLQTYIEAVLFGDFIGGDADCRFNQRDSVRERNWDKVDWHKKRALNNEDVPKDYRDWCDHYCNTNWSPGISGWVPGSQDLHDVTPGMGSLGWDSNADMDSDDMRDPQLREFFCHSSNIGRAWAAARYAYPFWRQWSAFIDAVEIIEEFHAKMVAFMAMVADVARIVELVMTDYGEAEYGALILEPYRLALEDTAASTLPGSVEPLLAGLEDLKTANQQVVDFADAYGYIARLLLSDLKADNDVVWTIRSAQGPTAARKEMLRWKKLQDLLAPNYGR